MGGKRHCEVRQTHNSFKDGVENMVLPNLTLSLSCQLKAISLNIHFSFTFQFFHIQIQSPTNNAD